MKLITNIDLSEKEECWEQNNGATRQTLKIINKTGKKINANNPFECKIGYLNKGKCSFIFIDVGIDESSKTVGLFLNSKYGFGIANGSKVKEFIYTASSCGGYGNSESQMALVEVDTLLYVNTYKNRSGKYYYQLEQNKWKSFGKDAPIESVDKINYI